MSEGPYRFRFAAWALSESERYRGVAAREDESPGRIPRFVDRLTHGTDLLAPCRAQALAFGGVFDILHIQ